MADKEIRHKVCKYTRYYSDGEGFYDGWWCENENCPDEECDYFTNDTYKCKYYVEGDNYDYC